MTDVNALACVDHALACVDHAMASSILSAASGVPETVQPCVCARRKYCGGDLEVGRTEHNQYHMRGAKVSSRHGRWFHVHFQAGKTR